MLPRKNDTRGEVPGANGGENEGIADEEITISNDKEAQRDPKMQLKLVLKGNGLGMAVAQPGHSDIEGSGLARAQF